MIIAAGGQDKSVCMGESGSQLESIRKMNKLDAALPLFTLQGGYDSTRLCGVYRLMMKAITPSLEKQLTQKKKRTPGEEKSLEMLRCGGSCVSIYDSSSSANIYMEGNWMEGGLWGITVPTGAPNINLGKIDDPEAADYNPGNNTFVNNGNNGELYDLFNNGTATIWAQGNTWNVIVQDEESIEGVIYHQADDPSKGLVIFMPPHQNNTAVEEIEAAQENDGLYYNLMGIPTSNPANGIFIHNGKKILVK